MVIPRSRSRSMLSMARSATRSLDRNVPLWCRRASTSVVLPWSTWAMMATLRRKGFAIFDEDIPPVYCLATPEKGTGGFFGRLHSEKDSRPLFHLRRGTRSKDGCADRRRVYKYLCRSTCVKRPG